MTTKAVKTIFFDAGGTLFDVDRGVGFQYHRLALKYGVVEAPDSLDRRFREAMQKSPPLAFPNVPPLLLQKREKEWWEHRVRDVFSGIDFPHFSSFFEELYSLFAGSDHNPLPWVCFEETLEVLENLSRFGYALGIISNFDSRIHPVLASLGIASFFKTVTFSTQAGVAKPSVEIFKQALSKAGCAPHETIHVGDDLKTDGVGAMEAGLSFIHVDRKPHPHPAVPSPLLSRASFTYNTMGDLRSIYNYLE